MPLLLGLRLRCLALPGTSMLLCALCFLVVQTLGLMLLSCLQSV